MAHTTYLLLYSHAQCPTEASGCRKVGGKGWSQGLGGVSVKGRSGVGGSEGLGRVAEPPIG